MRIRRSSKLERILRATETHMIRTISAATEAGLQSMKRDVPVDTGDLKSTCQKRDGKGHSMLMAGVPSQISDTFVDYELHIEFGLMPSLTRLRISRGLRTWGLAALYPGLHLRSPHARLGSSAISDGWALGFGQSQWRSCCSIRNRPHRRTSWAAEPRCQLRSRLRLRGFLVINTTLRER